MNPIEFALRRPVTVMVAMVALVAAGTLAVVRMKVDIFPALSLPVVYVAQPYGGMDPEQMEGLIANYYEYHFLYINGIHHVESKNIQGVSLMKLVFHARTDMAQAMAETVGYVNRARAFMPEGTVPPFVMRFDTGNVPVGYLVLSSETKTIGEIQDQALFKVRPMFAAIAGVSAPPPFGGNQRSIVVRVDPDRLRGYNLSADDLMDALRLGNAISPSGNIRTRTSMPLVPSNSLVVRPDELGTIAVKAGVFLRDVVRHDPVTGEALIEDATDIPTGYALVNGKRAVYICVTKRADASTLTVVGNVRANLPKMQAVLPADIKVSFEFDQSPYVTRSIRGLAFESTLAALLVGLMVLVFLRDWRSVIVVVLNIPLALIGALICLAVTGNTINLMTLGGLSLAVGILVDESTVEVENIHTQMDRADSIAVAVRRGNAETAVPRFLAMLVILAVFIPSFFMEGAAQRLFGPLSLAVGFAMVTSYLLSSTFVPVLSIWLLRHKRARQEASASPRASWVAAGFQTFLERTVRWRWLVVPVYLCGAVAGSLLLGRILGSEIFPQVDAGQFQFRLRAPSGTRIEQTEAITQEALHFIAREVGAENVAITLGYVGVVPSCYPINSDFLWMGGPEESVTRVSFKRGSVRIDELKRRLRATLPAHLQAWMRERWLADGVSRESASNEARKLRLSFEPADIVNEVMSFGSATPIEVVVSGPRLAHNRGLAEKIHGQLARIPALADLQFRQALDYPMVAVEIDREKAGLTGLTSGEVARSLVAATSSSRFVEPNFWRDPGTGIGYQVQIEIPQALMRASSDVAVVPVKQSITGPVLLRDVAKIREGTMAGEIDRFNMRRVASITANIQGEDLGRVTEQIAEAIRAAGPAPAGVEVDVRGQVQPMQEMSRGLTRGMAVAIAVIFLLLTGYFQSLRLALCALAAVPAVLMGVVCGLLATGTTLNLQSFMGAIMAVGVAVANAILLVTFAERNRREGMNALGAAMNAARMRARPIVMTSVAMIAGMLPMALGLGEAGDHVASLGRAVIAGLLASTLATLTVLPAVFAVLMNGSQVRSASLWPGDAQSCHFKGAQL